VLSRKWLDSLYLWGAKCFTELRFSVYGEGPERCQCKQSASIYDDNRAESEQIGGLGPDTER
jgi:hypothetical protein